MATLDAQRISDQLVRLVQIVFALVLAQSLFLFRPVVTNPLASVHRTAALALLTVFLTTVLSWIDWHITMEYHPYNTKRNIDYARLGADLFVVVTYAYLLFTIEPFMGHPDAHIGQHLLGYPAAFFFYLASGISRRLAYGPAASRIFPIVLFLMVYAGLAIAYNYAPLLENNPSLRNFYTLLFAIMVMISYRAFRIWYRKYLRKRKQAGLVIGVDVDGVIADQIDGVLPRVHEAFGLTLRVEDITHWRLPIGDSDISKEIERAQQNQDYVLSMKLNDGARSMLKALYQDNRVVFITARSPEAKEWTQQWVYNHGLPYDELLDSKEAKKSVHGTDVLIDDYLGNLMEYLQNTKGVAILVDQPWNRERDELRPLIDQGRVFVVSKLIEIPAVVDRIKAARREETMKSSSSGFKTSFFNQSLIKTFKGFLCGLFFYLSAAPF
jgi:uncharacterized HAD superfamily protein